MLSEKHTRITVILIFHNINTKRYKTHILRESWGNRRQIPNSLPTSPTTHSNILSKIPPLVVQMCWMLWSRNHFPFPTLSAQLEHVNARGHGPKRQRGCLVFDTLIMWAFILNYKGLVMMLIYLTIPNISFLLITVFNRHSHIHS